MDKAMEAAARKCGRCTYWKPMTPSEMGMCQCPSEALTRGAVHGRGWRRAEPSDRCFTGEFQARAALSAIEVE